MVVRVIIGVEELLEILLDLVGQHIFVDLL